MVVLDRVPSKFIISTCHIGCNLAPSVYIDYFHSILLDGIGRVQCKHIPAKMSFWMLYGAFSVNSFFLQVKFVVNVRAWFKIILVV